MKVSTKLQRKQMGQDKSQAKGAKRRPVVVKGLGIAIADALENQGETVRQAIVAVIGCNPETVLQSMLEVTARRDARIAECKGERKEKKIASVRVMYSRITVILKAIHAGLNVDKIKRAISFAEMYAFASNKAKRKDARHAKPFSADQFAAWSINTQRVVGEQPGKDGKSQERDRFNGQLARLEQHCLDVLGVLSKYAHTTRIPVREMLGLTAKHKQHLRKAA